MPHHVIAYDIWAKNIVDAKRELRKYLHIKRLPNNTQVWE
jgi:hypothetical protein